MQIVYRKMCLLFAAALLLTGCPQNQQPQMASYEMHYQNGIRFAKSGMFDQALREFQSSLELEPGYIPSEGSMQIVIDVMNGKVLPTAAMAIFRAIELGNKFDNQRKIKELNYAISIDPGYALAYNERGIAYFELGKFEQALLDRNRAIELAPNEPAAYYNKAVTCEHLKRYGEAIEAYVRFIERATIHQKNHVKFARQRIKKLQKVMNQKRHNT
jgi:tetratricopeptide (TPR) repeat protein